VVAYSAAWFLVCQSAASRLATSESAGLHRTGRSVPVEDRRGGLERALADQLDVHPGVGALELGDRSLEPVLLLGRVLERQIDVGGDRIGADRTAGRRLAGSRHRPLHALPGLLRERDEPLVLPIGRGRGAGRVVLEPHGHRVVDLHRARRVPARAHLVLEAG